MASTILLAIAVVVVPAIGAGAANPGSGSGYTPEEIHAHKSNHPGPFAEYRKSGIKHNATHHYKHYAPRGYRPI